MSIRIMSQNFADMDLLANFDVSSELAGFAKENAFNQARRSRFYRTGGRWEISTGTIKFREDSGGGDLTATLTPGTYLTTGEMITALQNAFNTAPGAGSVYTAEIDTITGKVKLTSNGTGGAGDFEIDWTDPVSAEMSDVLGFISDDAGSLIYLADVLKIAHPHEWILLDMGIETNPRNFLLTGERNKPLPLSPQGIYTLQANQTNPADWDTASFQKVLSHDDEIITEISDAGIADQAYRWWRLKFDDVGDTASVRDGNPELSLGFGSFFLGDELFSSLTDAVNRGKVRFGFSSQYVDLSTTGRAEGGETTSSKKELTQEFSFDWNGVTKEQIQELTDFWERVGTHTGFFIVFDPCGPVNWGKLERSAKFVKFVDEPSWDIEFTDHFTPLSMRVREEL